MRTPPSLPIGAFERAKMLHDLLLARATNGPADDSLYRDLRADLLGNPAVAALVPVFVKDSRDLAEFWKTISDRASSRDLKRKVLKKAFAPVLARLERTDRAPADIIVGEALSALNSSRIIAIWDRALARCRDEPDAALTSARQLIESVCKHILDDLGVSYSPNIELPRLWALCAQKLNLAPNQHTEEIFRSILGNCQAIVNQVGGIRNRHGDAHGEGRNGTSPEQRHAVLAVNLAGTMTSFLIDTYKATKPSTG